MIICESKQYIEELAMEVGISCIQLNLLQIIDESLGITVTQAGQVLALQSAIYALVLGYMWLVKGTKTINDN